MAVGFIPDVSSKPTQLAGYTENTILSTCYNANISRGLVASYNIISKINPRANPTFRTPLSGQVSLGSMASLYSSKTVCVSSAPNSTISLGSSFNGAEGGFIRVYVEGGDFDYRDARGRERVTQDIYKRGGYWEEPTQWYVFLSSDFFNQFGNNGVTITSGAGANITLYPTCCADSWAAKAYGTVYNWYDTIYIRPHINNKIYKIPFGPLGRDITLTLTYTMDNDGNLLLINSESGFHPGGNLVL